MKAHDDEERMWQAVVRRDAGLAGEFLLGVMTTGIFCRPGCPTRTPLRKNVRFFATAAEARAAGFRACLRCQPEAEQAGTPSVRRMREVAAWLRQNSAEPAALKLQSLADRFGLSPFHLQRSFKAVHGVSPRRYVEALRVAALKEELRAGEGVTTATYAAGFASPRQMYGSIARQLGMTPGGFRAGGEGMSISYATLETRLGLLMLGATDRGLCFVEFGASAQELLATLREEFPRATLQPVAEPHPPQLQAWTAALREYLEDERQRHSTHSIPLLLHGTAFQTAVWQYLQSIPAGTVKTYTEVAAAIGRPRAVRAVASACAANRIAVLVPCHRVLRGDGGMGGYRWGVERKQALLEAERAATA